jgi:hypothetical protein
VVKAARDRARSTLSEKLHAGQCMLGRTSALVAWLVQFWRALAPAAHAVEPEVSTLDEWRTAFAWRGAPLTFDRRRRLVLRGGRTLLRLADVRSIDIQHIDRDDERPEYWRVSLGTGLFSSIELGTTPDDVEASIAAARLSTIVGVKVRAL